MGVRHKKTRRQKIIADFRHKEYILKDINIASTSTVILPNNKQSSPSYSHVLRDVLKTGLLTLSIIMGEVILFFLLKKHIIILPKISY